MAVVIDLTANPPVRPKRAGQSAGLRHPEKAHRPDAESPRKPDWIRVKAASASTRLPFPVSAAGRTRLSMRWDWAPAMRIVEPPQRGEKRVSGAVAPLLKH